jgi:hypothetical protein
VQEFTIGVERDALWEMDSVTDSYFAFGTSSLSVAGGLWSWGGLAEGDNPGSETARINRTVFEYVGGSASGTASEYWWGWKTAHSGIDLTNFISTWECELGDNYGTDTTEIADAAASNGNTVRCTFTNTATKATRLTVTTDDVSANEIDQRGSYAVLLRARCTDNQVADVWLADGIENRSGFREHSRVRVSNTSDYMLHAMGTVHIPPFGATELIAPFSDLVNNYALRLAAASAGVAGNLLMDCFYLIPTDEGAAYVSGGGVGTAGDDLIVTTEQDGQQYAFSRGAAIDTPPSLSTIDYELPTVPAGGSRMVLCAQTGTAHRLADTLAVTVHYVSRWPTLRGAADT